MAVETPPSAGVSPPQNGQSHNDHEMLDEGEGIVRRIVFGKIDGHELPGKAEVTVKREPPESQQDEVEAACAETPAGGSGMRAQSQREKKEDLGKKKQGIAENRTGSGKTPQRVVA